MKSFLARHASKIKGVLQGFDRIRFRGTLRWLANTKGMMNWLWHQQVRLTGFKELALSLTDQIDEEAERLAKTVGPKVTYLESSKTSKEDVAQVLAAERRIHEGMALPLAGLEVAASVATGGAGRGRLSGGPAGCAGGRHSRRARRTHTP
ncbi:MAG TPA: hypothetical protein VGM05_11035, partial [Planctomycetaceae bacterium]